MTDTPQLSGRDLARQALAAYKATASTTPAKTPGRPKRNRSVRTGSGRDPISLASAIAGLGADLPLEAGVAGGSVIDQWATLCPQYAGLVQPVSYDEHTGRLDLRPGSHSYAAQLRLLGGQLAKQINDKMGRTVVRTIRVLAVGNITLSSTPDAPATERHQSEAPVKTREMACGGYREALEAHFAARPESPATAPGVEDAIERQDRVLADRRNREPETAFTDAVAEAERITGPELRPSEVSRRAALAFKRGEAAAGPVPVRRAFDVA